MCIFPLQVENASKPASQLDQAIACYLAGAELLPARRPPKSCRASMNSCEPIVEHEVRTLCPLDLSWPPSITKLLRTNVLVQDEGKNINIPALPADGKLEAELGAVSQVKRLAVVASPVPQACYRPLVNSTYLPEVIVSNCCRGVHHQFSHHSSKVSHSCHTGGRHLNQQPPCPGAAVHTPGHIALTSQMTLLPPHAYHSNTKARAQLAVPADAMVATGNSPGCSLLHCALAFTWVPSMEGFVAALPNPQAALTAPIQ